MVHGTTRNEDLQGLDKLDEVIGNAKLVGKGELSEDELPTIEVLWETLCKILGVDV